MNKQRRQLIQYVNMMSHGCRFDDSSIDLMIDIINDISERIIHPIVDIKESVKKYVPGTDNIPDVHLNTLLALPYSYIKNDFIPSELSKHAISSGYKYVESKFEKIFDLKYAPNNTPTDKLFITGVLLFTVEELIELTCYTGDNVTVSAQTLISAIGNDVEFNKSGLLHDKHISNATKRMKLSK